MNEILFNIKEYTSQDSDHPANEILKSKNLSRGWFSNRYCNYPQHIILDLGKSYKIQEMLILSHQSKIASKVDIYIGNIEYNDISSDFKFEKLGNFYFNNNENRNYKFRELKTITLYAECSLIKLIFHKCHYNNINIFNQISIINIKLSGTEIDSKDGLNSNYKEYRVNSHKENLINYENNISKNLNFENHIEELEKNKTHAIKNEDYLEADKLKNIIKNILENNQKVSILENKLKNTLLKEEYMEAHNIKQEINKLKNLVEKNSKEIINKNITYEKEIIKEKVIEENYSEKINTKNENIITENNRENRNSSYLFTNNPEERPIIAGDSNIYENAKEDDYQENNENDENEEIDEKYIKLAENIYPLYPDNKQLVNYFFSKKWVKKEIFLKKLIEDITNDSYKDKQVEIFIIIMFICSIGLNDGVFQIQKLILEILIKTLENFKIEKITTNEFNMYLEVVIKILMEKLNNSKLKDNAIKSIKLMSSNEVIGFTDVISSLTKIKGLPNTLSLPKNISSRILIVKDLVLTHGYNSNKKILLFSLEYLENKNNDIRNNSLNLLQEITKNLDYEKFLIISKEYNIKNTIINLLKKEVFDQNNIINNIDDNINKESISTDFCIFCNVKNKNFSNENIKDMHFVKECPMLNECINCKNVIEINEINNHLQNECTKKENFTKCDKCHLIINKNNFDNHNCKEIDNENQRACPLCNIAIGKTLDGLKNHILKDGCLNNPRTNIS